MKMIKKYLGIINHVVINDLWIIFLRIGPNL